MVCLLIEDLGPTRVREASAVWRIMRSYSLALDTQKLTRESLHCENLAHRAKGQAAALW